MGKDSMVIEKLYSNPITNTTNVNQRSAYTYTPKGDMPYVVRFSDESWIPVNVLVFSDTSIHAIEEVVTAVTWLRNNAVVHHDKPDILLKGTREYYEKILTLDRYCQVVKRVPSAQLFKVGWADNDSI